MTNGDWEDDACRPTHKKNQEEEAAAAAASRGETGNQLAPAAALSQLAIVETSQLLERRASSHLSLCCPYCFC